MELSASVPDVSRHLSRRNRTAAWGFLHRARVLVALRIFSLPWMIYAISTQDIRPEGQSHGCALGIVVPAKATGTSTICCDGIWGGRWLAPLPMKLQPCLRLGNPSRPWRSLLLCRMGKSQSWPASCSALRIVPLPPEGITCDASE